MKGLKIRTNSAEETRSVGVRMGRKAVCGLFLALCGPMGCGKTTFTQGFAAGVGFVKNPVAVTSPTYTLIHELPTRIPIYHIDLFRLSSLEEIEEVGYNDIPLETSITVVEWAQKLSLPESFIKIKFAFCSEQIRDIEISCKGDNWAGFLESLAQEIR